VTSWPVALAASTASSSIDSTSSPRMAAPSDESLHESRHRAFLHSLYLA
jgi:hypothetical protein